MTSRFSQAVQDHPLVLLSVIFVAWKVCIILVTLASPGVGYDTSTSLLYSQASSLDSILEIPRLWTSRWLNFVRWDAIYFTHISEEGPVYEQEWAFGIGLSTAISWITACRMMIPAPFNALTEKASSFNGVQLYQ